MPAKLRPLILAAVVVLLVGAVVAVVLIGEDTDPADTDPADTDPADTDPADIDPNDENDEPEEPAFAPLTGEQIDDPIERPVIATKVENSPQARPQAGLQDADIVFELLTEGGITRFLALHHRQLPDEIGPIRSARLSDLDLAPAYEPVLAISGARPEVLSALTDRVEVVTETGPPRFSRRDDRPAPHDLYVRPGELLEAGDLPPPPVEPVWEFSDRAPPGGRPVSDLTVTLSPVSETGWTYDGDQGTYARLQDGEPHEVEGPGRIGATNVVIMGAEVEPLEDDLVSITLIGEGPAIVLRDGQRYDGRWTKPDAATHLALRDHDGEVLPLKPGPTWVVVPPVENVPQVDS